MGYGVLQSHRRCSKCAGSESESALLTNKAVKALQGVSNKGGNGAGLTVKEKMSIRDFGVNSCSEAAGSVSSHPGESTHANSGARRAEEQKLQRWASLRFAPDPLRPLVWTLQYSYFLTRSRCAVLRSWSEKRWRSG